MIAVYEYIQKNYIWANSEQTDFPIIFAIVANHGTGYIQTKTQWPSRIYPSCNGRLLILQ